MINNPAGKNINMPGLHVVVPSNAAEALPATNVRRVIRVFVMIEPLSNSFETWPAIQDLSLPDGLRGE